jgi:hypothetical protein
MNSIPATCHKKQHEDSREGCIRGDKRDGEQFFGGSPRREGKIEYPNGFGTVTEGEARNHGTREINKQRTKGKD